MEPAIASRAPLRIQLLFWLLLGAWSVFLAEVVCFSSPFPFFTGWGLLVVLPLYTLHALVLAWIVFRPDHSLNLRILFLAGAIFGLYEAYITKVLWQPTWGEMTWAAGGIYVVQSAVLVLFWHPWMAFILPLFATETLFTASREVAGSLPRRGKSTWIIAACAVYCGLYQGINSPSIQITLLSNLGAGLVLAALALLWRRATRRTAYTLRELLPSGRQGGILAGLLLLLYVVQGILIRPEALPRTFGPHLTIWGLYLLFGILLYLNLRRARLPETAIPPAAVPVATTPLWKFVLLFAVLFPLAAVLAGFIRVPAALLIQLSWICGAALGAWLVVKSVLALFRRSHKTG